MVEDDWDGSSAGLVWIWYWSAWPLVPVIVLALVMAGGSGRMVKFSDSVSPPPAFDAVMLAVKFPNTVAVPETMPVVVSMLNPAGRLVAEKLVG